MIGNYRNLKLIATLSLSLFILMVLILNTILPAAFAADGQFNTPFGVGIDSSSNVYVTDSGNDRIQKFKNSAYLHQNVGYLWYCESNAGQFYKPIW